MLILSYIELFWRRKWVFFIVLAVGCGLAISNWHNGRLYVSRSILMVQKSEGGGLLSGLSQAPGAGLPMMGRALFQKDLYYLQSVPFQLRVAAKILEHPEGGRILRAFEALRPSPQRRIFELVMGIFGSSAPETESPDRRGFLVSHLGGRIKVGMGDLNSMEISATFPDAELSVLIAQIVTDEAVAFLNERQLQELDESKKYLTQKLEQSEGNLRALDTDFVKMEGESEFPISSGAGGVSLLGGTMEEFHRAKLRLRENEKLIESIKKRLFETTTKLGKKRAVDPELIVSLRREIETLQTKRAALESEGFAKDSFQMKVIAQQLATAKLHLSGIEEKSKNAPKEDTSWTYVGLTQKLRELNQENLFLSAKLDVVQKIVKPNSSLAPSERMRKLDYLIKRSDLQYAFYSELTKRLFDVEMRRIAVQNQLSVVEPPSSSRLMRTPTLSKNLIVAVVFSILIASLLTYQLEQLNPLLLNARDIEAMLVRVMGQVPDLTPSWRLWTKSPHIAEVGSVLIHMNRSDSREGLIFKHLRNRLLQFIQKNDSTVHLLTLTSAGQGEGKSFITMNLAYSVAKLGKKVLVVDADLRARRVTRTLAPNAFEGLCNASEPGASVRGKIVKDCLPGLDVLPAGDLPDDPSEFFAAPSIPKLLREISEGYDFVFIDTPPSIEFPEGSILSSLTDATILIGCAGKTRLKSFATLVQNLDETAPKLWSILNKSTVDSRILTYPSYPTFMNKPTTKAS